MGVAIGLLIADHARVRLLPHLPPLATPLVLTIKGGGLSVT